MGTEKKPAAKGDAAGPDTPPEVSEEQSVVNAEGKELYVLTKAYWDGKVQHPRGSRMYFAEDEGPSSKVPVGEAQTRPLNKVPLTTAGNEVAGK